MAAMQIYIWELRHSTGMARHYASHQLDLHMLVLSHLRKTYWTADLQHNLFTEVLKIMENGPHTTEKVVTETAHHQEHSQAVEQANGEATDDPQAEYWMQGTLEDFLHSFNPFMGLPGDDIT